MDREIEVEDSWQIDLFERKNGCLALYLLVGWAAIWIATVVLNFRAHRTSRRGNTGVESRSETTKKLLKITRGHFVIANIYMAHVLILTLADTIICAGVITDDVAADPDYYSENIHDIAFLVLSLLAVFIATFFLVPLLQMLLVTWALGRFSKKHGSEMLGDYIPEARLYSTHIAQTWAMIAFYVTGFWSPASDNAVWRYVILQACLGSAFAWLQASMAFNYRYEQLEDVPVAYDGSGRVRNIVRMFSQTAKVVHTWAEKKEALPRYEDSPDTPLLKVQE